MSSKLFSVPQLYLKPPYVQRVAKSAYATKTGNLRPLPASSIAKQVLRTPCLKTCNWIKHTPSINKKLVSARSSPGPSSGILMKYAGLGQTKKNQAHCRAWLIEEEKVKQPLECWSMNLILMLHGSDYALCAHFQISAVAT